MILAPFKLLAIITIISSFVVVNSILFLFTLPFPFFRRKILVQSNALHSKVMLKTLGFHLTLNGPLPKRGVLIVGNHMSYLDIMIYLSFFKTVFVTSVDMKHRLFLGQITLLGGCLYVERRNPKNLPNELRTLKQYFDRGFSVCIFPEGTSSDGQTVLPFKKSLFQVALETQAPVQPIVLKYNSVDEVPFGDKNRDTVCWYGELKFLPHILNLLTLKKVKATLTPLAPISTSEFQNRKDLAQHTHSLILKHYETI